MARKKTFGQQLKSHKGGLVRVRPGPGAAGRVFGGKIGLLMNSNSNIGSDILGAVRIELLIDGSVKKFILYPCDLEFIGADDAS
jgi:hypothetical protein